MYKAEVKVTTYSQQGWDSYFDVQDITLRSASKKQLNKEIDKYRKTNSVGDFGIVLGRTVVEVISFCKVVSEEVVVEVPCNER